MMNALVLVLWLSSAVESDAAFVQGKQHFDSFALDEAVQTFTALAARTDLSPADRAVVLVWLGMSYAELRDDPRAGLAFEDAVVADPLIVLPKDASPKTKQMLEDARGRVRLRPHTPPPSATPEPTVPPEEAPVAAAPSTLWPWGIGAAALGGVALVAGGAVWGVGLVLRDQANAETFQDDAAATRDVSLATQLGGQIAVGAGLTVAVAGGVLLGLAAAE